MSVIITDVFSGDLLPVGTNLTSVKFVRLTKNGTRSVINNQRDIVSPLGNIMALLGALYHEHEITLLFMTKTLTQEVSVINSGGMIIFVVFTTQRQTVQLEAGKFATLWEIQWT